MKGLWKEFKAFIFRGNVVDMAIGVIVASAFTAIVNGLSNFVLKPLVNWVLASLLGADSLSEVFTVLKGVPKLSKLAVPPADITKNSLNSL